MEQTRYIRPILTDAAKLGERRRHHWSHLLRQRALCLLPVLDLKAVEETHTDTARSRRGQNKAAWINTSLRVDQIAVVEVLQKLHLENTGKEISRAEVMAALMAAGLETVLASAEFNPPR